MTSMKIVLGVSGGIAAYKSAEIVRGLVRGGADVTVVMTAHAHQFIAPLTLQTLSGRRVLASHFDIAASADAGDVEHVGLARRCDLLLVAPATANVLAKMAAGIADDLLSTFYLAVSCSVIVAPAMNTRMWEHPAVRAAVATLRGRGVRIVEPESGPLASRSEGDGVGRLAAPERIVAEALRAGRPAGAASPGAGPVQPGPLKGRRVLVSAGPTREALDPVRFLSNPSSGRMGYAVAEAARDLGADVTLVSGPTDLADPPGVTTVRVISAEQMRREILARLKGAHVVVKAAAVSDFRPVERSERKVKKEGAPLTIELTPTPDILAEVGRRKGRRFLVGFAAETDDIVRHARAKLKRKNLDLIVANDVSRAGTGFGSLTNEVVVIGRDGRAARWPSMTKHDVAGRLMRLVASRLG